MDFAMKHTEWKSQSADGVGLYRHSWAPEGEARAVITLVHGFGEHSSRYAHVAAALAAEGYALVTGDHRGHGQSHGPRGHTPTYDHLMDDIGALLDEAAQRFPARPRFIYGHSMGGNLALNYVLRRRPKLDGAVVTAPWLRLAFEPPRWKVAIGRAMNNIYPTLLQDTGLDLDALSRDATVGQAYGADPLVHSKMSARMFSSLYAAGLWALDHASEFPLPLLLMHGGADRITSAQASREFAAKAPDCTFKIWDGWYHEIHNEPEQQQIFAAITGWLNQRLSATEQVSSPS
jgi:alpha-beta hydrolase superfamily lysophospholipase